MAETKKPAETAKKSTAKKAAPAYVPTPEEKSKATGLRIGAVILWIAAFACEALAVLTVFKKLFKGLNPTMRIVVMIAFLVADLIVLIIGSALWKKSNRLDPASEKNKAKFWLWNNLGVIAAAFAFIPFIILVLLNKDTDKKTKTIATVVAVIALLIGGLASADWNPISAEQKAAAIQYVKGEVYINNGSDIYHLPDCNYIREGNKLAGEIKTEGVTKYENVEAAINDGAIRLCKSCLNRHKDELGGHGLLTSEGVDEKTADTEALTEAPATDAEVETDDAE